MWREAEKGFSFVFSFFVFFTPERQYVDKGLIGCHHCNSHIAMLRETSAHILNLA